MRRNDCRLDLATDIDRRAATGAADSADADGERLDLSRAQLPHEALLDHELRKRDKAPVLLRAAVVIGSNRRDQRP